MYNRPTENNEICVYTCIIQNMPLYVAVTQPIDSDAAILKSVTYNDVVGNWYKVEITLHNSHHMLDDESLFNTKKAGKEGLHCV